MNPQDVLLNLEQQLEILNQIIHQSPYLSRETRIGLEKEITEFFDRLKEGAINIPQGERIISDLDKKAAVDEIGSLLAKIGYLNPSSPRLEPLRNLSLRLREGEISPEQARKGIQELMQG